MAEQQRQFRAIPEPKLDLASMLATLNAIKENVEVLTGARKAVPGIADQLTDLKSVTGRLTARFTEYVQVSTGNNIALARRTTTLETDMYGNFGRITLLEESMTTADQALAQRSLTLETDMHGNTGRVSTLERSLSDADSALAERTTSLETDVRGNTGRVSTIERALSDVDDALAERIDSVEATTAGGTAGGRIAFRANAGPSGYTASYDLTLTAAVTGGAEALAGMSILAKALPGGGYSGSIAFTANSLMMFDPALGPLPVFAYSNGLFVFNVPVEVRTGDIARRAITVPVFARNGAGQGGFSVSVIITVPDSGTVVDIEGDFDGQPTLSFSILNSNQNLILTRANADGTNPVEVARRPICFYVTGSNENRAVQFIYQGLKAQDTPGYAGQFIYTLATTIGYGPVSIKIMGVNR